jgi:amino acid adenylation domain-containing protein
MSEAIELSEVKRRLLAQMLNATAGTSGAPQPAGVPVRDAAARPRLSAEQSHVWLHASMAPDLPLYNEPITIHRRGSFDLAILQRAFAELLRRHEIWRTALVEEEGEVRQIVHPTVDIDLNLVDLSGLPESEQEAEALKLATRDSRLPFDLAQAPLFRVKVMKFSETQHRLHLTLHHIIFDGVAIYRTIVPELSEIYDAFAAGRTPDLPEPKLQYGDYTLWREQRLASPEIRRQIGYWRDKLAGELPVLQLPWDHPRPALVTYRGSMEVFDLAPALTEQLKALARQEGTTLYMVLLAGFKALLHRYSGQTDIPVGGVTDTRRRPELENLVGYFLNTIVLRTRTDGETRFRDYLASVRKTLLEALANSEVPFDWVVRELSPRRDPSCHPFFQVLFSMEPPAPQFRPGWDLTQMEVTVGTAKFDLYLELDEREDRIIGRFLYNSMLFDASTIRRMIGHWTRLLQAVVADPACSLARLPILAPEEERRLLVEWNATAHPCPDLTLDRWIAQQALLRPDAVALRFGDEEWSYRALMQRVGAIAGSLRAHGVGPEVLVGLSIERSPDMLAGLLGILAAGGAYLPLDPAFPATRLEMILEDAKPAAILTTGGLAALLPASAARILLVEECQGEAGEPCNSSPDRLAYVLYTSGSTGRPKGVEITHRALVNLLASMQRQPGFGPQDSLLAVTTVSFDIAGLELFLPLVSGGTVILASKETATDPLLLAEAIKSSGCRMMQATPAHWRALIEAGWPGAAQLTMLCGGEALPRELADRLLGRGADLWNVYGPTETTIWSTAEHVQSGAPISIGRPIANTRIYILDDRGQPLPAGVPGHLYIGGTGLARGYRNREDLTRERFVMLPTIPGERLYRTGDLARWRGDGCIEWLGRSDNQVKIRGFRIELEEIEAALLRHEQIAAAAVRTWPDAAGLPSLSAYIVPRGEIEPDAADLRAFLQQHLPDYMLPARITALARMPMTPNRKIDRNALPKPEISAAATEAAEPETEAEQKMAALWCAVLDVPRVGAHDDFFALGGHSLLATTLLRRVEREFGVALPMAAIFRSPTVRRLAALVGEARTVPSRGPDLPAAAAGTDPIGRKWAFGALLQSWLGRDAAARPEPGGD